MKKIALVGFGLGVAVLFSGCAGMFSGKTQIVTIKSEPEGATVLINGMEHGKTPLTTSIGKSKDLLLTVRKDGFKDVSMPMNTAFDPMALVGLMSYGFPITTDVQSGTAYQVSPNYYSVELKKKD